MTIKTSQKLVAELRRLGLLTDEAVGRIASAPLTNTEQFARLLMEAGLTRFQTQVILSGQASRLLFGPYILLEKIGEGGMGVVYKARHARLGRIDALKVLRVDKIGSKMFAKRFLREIELTSNLEHPHIVRAYDAGSVGKQLYLATEYVNGTDLATQVVTQGPLSVADACLVMYQTGLALQHIHEKGLVHRDLKPSNLIRDRSTHVVKVLDLGLSGFSRTALEAENGLTLTRDGAVLGTPDYMAPEQVQNPHGVDIRADLYSLGCTAYFLMTGRPPFEGSPVEKMYYHGFAPPPALILPHGLVPPAGLAEILGRLMAKRPEDRFPSPQEMIDALLALRPSHQSPPVPVAVMPVPSNSQATQAPGKQTTDSPVVLFQNLQSELLGPAKVSPSGPGASRVSKTRNPWLLLSVGLLLFGIGLLTSAAIRVLSR